MSITTSAQTLDQRIAVPSAMAAAKLGVEKLHLLRLPRVRLDLLLGVRLLPYVCLRHHPLAILGVALLEYGADNVPARVGLGLGLGLGLVLGVALLEYGADNVPAERGEGVDPIQTGSACW